MRLGPVMVVAVLGSACRADPTPRSVTSQGDRTAAPGVTQTAAPGLAGCYVLSTGSVPPYRLRLAPSGEASLIGLGAEPNRPGNAWEWSAKTDSTFVITWSGIDSWMAFHVERRAGTWVASGVITTATGDTPITPTIERVECPVPGA